MGCGVYSVGSRGGVRVWGVVVWAVGGLGLEVQRHLAPTRADCHQITWFREGLAAFELDAGSRLVGG